MIKKSWMFLVFMSLFACKPNNDIEIEDEMELDKVQMSSSEHADRVKMVLYNIPTPVEVTSLLLNIGLSYNPEVLNSYDKVEGYITTEDAAINLGIYGTDLSYNRLYDQVQESINYYLAIRKLSHELGIYDQKAGETVERLEQTVENKDSLLSVVSKIYTDTDTYLKSNDRGSVAALVIVGGWIEAMYIATQVATSVEENQKIMLTIKDQKASLENLIFFLKGYQDDKIVAKYLRKLEPLKKAFDKVELVTDKFKVSTDEKTGVTTIDNNTTIKISYKDFENIGNIVKEIRNDMI